MAKPTENGYAAELALVGLVCLGLRFSAVHYGLPGLFNADEPHFVNVAVSFGKGSLNPGIFKCIFLQPF